MRSRRLKNTRNTAFGKLGFRATGDVSRTMFRCSSPSSWQSTFPCSRARKLPDKFALAGSGRYKTHDDKRPFARRADSKRIGNPAASNFRGTPRCCSVATKFCVDHFRILFAIVAIASSRPWFFRGFGGDQSASNAPTQLRSELWISRIGYPDNYGYPDPRDIRFTRSRYETILEIENVAMFTRSTHHPSPIGMGRGGRRR